MYPLSKIAVDYFLQDLFITIGGDGTLLQAIHLMDTSIPVLGVNSDPTRPEEVAELTEEFDATRSTGYLCAATANNFEHETIVKELAALPKDTCDTKARSDIFKVIGEDKNGYANTSGLGVKVPRSSTKRCALEEERAKRIRSEEIVQVLQKQMDENSAQIEFLTNLVKKVIEQQGIEIEDALENDVETNGEDEVHEDELEDML